LGFGGGPPGSDLQQKPVLIWIIMIRFFPNHDSRNIRSKPQCFFDELNNMK
jgi:hypothetical protein